MNAFQMLSRLLTGRKDSDGYYRLVIVYDDVNRKWFASIDSDFGGGPATHPDRDDCSCLGSEGCDSPQDALEDLHRVCGSTA